MMITVQKQDVANLLLVEYLATTHIVNEKLRLFEHKYAQTWHEFSEAIQNDPNEDFDRWDDYIEWKAYIKTSEEVEKKMDEVRHGNFEVA